MKHTEMYTYILFILINMYAYNSLCTCITQSSMYIGTCACVKTRKLVYTYTYVSTHLAYLYYL